MSTVYHNPFYRTVSHWGVPIMLQKSMLDEQVSSPFEKSCWKFVNIMLKNNVTEIDATRLKFYFMKKTRKCIKKTKTTLQGQFTEGMAYSLKRNGSNLFKIKSTDSSVPVSWTGFKSFLRNLAENFRIIKFLKKAIAPIKINAVTY